jgi:hypothetical protein
LKEETLALFEKAERSIRNAEKTMADGDLDLPGNTLTQNNPLLQLNG